MGTYVAPLKSLRMALIFDVHSGEAIFTLLAAWDGEGEAVSKAFTKLFLL